MTAQEMCAHTLLRGVGGRTVLLRMPAPAMPGDLGEQLGLAVPLFQDVPLGPVVFRKLRPKVGTPEKPKEAAYELLVSASAATHAAGICGFEAVAALFAQAAGILIDGTSFGIVSVTEAEAFGSPYLYRLGLCGTVADFT